MEVDYLELSNERKEVLENDWRRKLIRNDKRAIVNHIDNFILFLTESDEWKGRLKYNEFLQQKEIDGRLFEDFDQEEIYVSCERELTLSSKTKIDTAVNYVFSHNKYNPIQDYLKNLSWDGEKRIEEVFIKLLEADDTELNRSMSKKWFMAGVKRVMFPGCKFDNILIFQGAQGIGKTTICEKISKGFSNVVLLSEISNKDVIDKLNKTWIGIVDEMDAFSKKDMTTVKTFLSTSIDSVRLAYGHNTQSYKRHSIFIGSTNDETFLRDSTSSTERRFWIIKSHKEKYTPIVNELLTEEYVDQLWAEAYHELFKDVNQYLDIDSNLSNDFSTAQKDFKTFNDDFNIDYVRDILDKAYVLVNGEFNDNNDFLRQYNDDNVYTAPKSYINKIPLSSLLYVLKSVYKIDMHSKYLKIALSADWDYKNIWYKGKSYKGLCRKNSNSETILAESQDDIFI